MQVGFNLNVKFDKNKEKVLGVAFFLVALYFLIRGTILAFSVDIWYDELFSVEFAKRPISDLIGLTARDVHPPLYYIILRIMYLVLKETNLPLETIAKLTSILPFGLLFIYSVTAIRKRFGILAAGIFSFASITMPQLPEYTTEIRMYGWCILFVTAALLHGFGLMDSYSNGKNTKWDIKNALGIFVSSVATFYSHYYAAMSVGIIYGLLIIWMLTGYVKAMTVHNRISFKAFAIVIISLNMTVISYVPWISVVANQVKSVKNNYWIQPVGLRSLGSAAKYIYSGYFIDTKKATAFAIVMILLTAVLLAFTVFERYKNSGVATNRVIDMTLMSFLVMPLLIIAGIIASLLIRPVFVNRYMIPAMGTFWLAISVMISREAKQFIDKMTDASLKDAIKDLKLSSVSKKISALSAFLMMIVMFIVGVVDYKAFIGNEEYRYINMTKTLELFDGLSEDTIIISNFDQAQALMAYYLNDNADISRYVYLYKGEPEQLINEMVPGLKTIDDSVDIYNYLSAGKRVLFLGSFNSREVLLQEWKDDYGITYENKGSYLMERYWFDVFELNL